MQSCKREILSSYGLSGVPVAVKEKLEMCPTVKTSCCTREDQLSIYTNWIANNEKDRVYLKYEETEKTYNTLLYHLQRVRKLAKIVKDALKKRKVSNCKVMTERILTFEVGKIAPQIRLNLRKQKLFFVETYQGFYCTICNYHNHQYFNLEKQTVKFSEKFCRDLIESTLPNLLFFHVEVVKYFNLVSKFLTTCDHAGVYRLDNEVKKENTFVVLPELKHDLQECKDNRNTKYWFHYCKDICNNFRITTYSEFFEPNIRQIEKYITFLNDNLKGIELDSEQNPPNSGGAHAKPTPHVPAKPEVKAVATMKKERRLAEMVTYGKETAKPPLPILKQDFADQLLKDLSGVDLEAENRAKAEIEN